jgi:hypothetical protein
MRQGLGYCADAVKEFQPDVIMAAHVHSGMVVLPLSQTLEVPMLLLFRFSNTQLSND